MLHVFTSRAIQKNFEHLNLCFSITSFRYILESFELDLSDSHLENKLTINISTEKQNYIKGELIDAYVLIKNNTGDSIKFNYSKFYLITDKSETLSQPAFHDGSVAVIAPFGEIKLLMSPLETIAFKDDDNRGDADYPWYYWSVGNYK